MRVRCSGAPFAFAPCIPHERRNVEYLRFDDAIYDVRHDTFYLLKPPTTLSIADAKVTEGDPGGPNAKITFVVTRGGDTSAETTVMYAVTAGSATNPQSTMPGPANA